MAKMYKLGYLLSPLVPAEAVAEAVERAVKTPLRQAGGEVKSERSPKMTPLAYPIRRAVNNKHQVVREAYFGTLTFVAPGSALPELGAEWRKDAELVRTLVTEAVIEPPRPTGHFRPAAEEGEPLPAAEASPEAVKEVIDREIEQLVNVSQ